MKKIAVVGCGYVGLSLSILLAQNHMVTVIDNVSEKIDKINSGISTVKDEDIEYYLRTKPLYLSASLDASSIYKEADFVIVAVPTDYDSELDYFDCSNIDSVVEKVLSVSDKAVIVIKSTVPIGYTERLRQRFETNRIIFSPEFLRESKALYDNLHPNRIVFGCDRKSRKYAEEFSELLIEGAVDSDVPTLFTGLSEAESIKLFSNAYLAMRVSFFNELDTFAEKERLNTAQIIKGVCLDPRIGDYYNNPSFGYGGYCLPKDSKQLLSNYKNIPQELFRAIVTSNQTRKLFLFNQILKKVTQKTTEYVLNSVQKDIVVGIYRIVMKENSDNFRLSAILDIMTWLENFGVEIIVFEPLLEEEDVYTLCQDIRDFKLKSDIIITNRYDSVLDDVKDKVYTRDCFSRD